jgi:hypothetical protein
VIEKILINDKLSELEERFNQGILKDVNEHKKTDPECYSNLNITEVDLYKTDLTLSEASFLLTFCYAFGNWPCENRYYYTLEIPVGEAGIYFRIE